MAQELFRSSIFTKFGHSLSLMFLFRVLLFSFVWESSQYDFYHSMCDPLLPGAQEMKYTCSKINHCTQSSVPLEPCPNRTCALVLNPGSLLNHKYGPLIDKHDLVIRVNHGPEFIKGFEKYVGTRTDVLFAVLPMVENGLRHPPHYKFSIRGGNLKRLLNMLSALGASSDNIILPDGAHESDCLELFYPAITGHHRCSTGANAYLVARTFCSSISLFGYDEDMNQPQHYYEKEKTPFPTLHNFILEHIMFGYLGCTTDFLKLYAPPNCTDVHRQLVDWIGTAEVPPYLEHYLKSKPSAYVG
mmetsp:Transcript_5428/g.6992  ORF Transcript_5428/g.6992 Transcript_5428/m.6992 type:complete len:301 (+) Transcript_5428:134-1036(+)|eukprot:CAMPEP_0201491118 /NCGR_PEP_ID=MMETSP0151_2-20130828/28637_1 /ASSEMBLY_ACC=CAM_ASM_000257 /TAXON_ID=200890 /ORGANISM="Paramoeba atlantica, Strain 621/1 / CCAP 1560/9" /LENGTH=300 /DNA_ID=CAMNT_0047877333 /DNA_START=122 /DNA_END=1024 /DNA_ORIENTATION=-